MNTLARLMMPVMITSSLLSLAQPAPAQELIELPRVQLASFVNDTVFETPTLSFGPGLAAATETTLFGLPLNMGPIDRSLRALI
ncbi:MAG: hypothetical protein CVV27_10310, partial [Candidatus Melainabacteria bacterium HGW-Melainabacteria-1]